jgi:hypothetical protein
MLPRHGSWMIRMLASIGTVPTTTGVDVAGNGISASFSGTNLAVDLAAGFVACFSELLATVDLGSVFAASSGRCSFRRLLLYKTSGTASTEPLRGPIW